MFRHADDCVLCTSQPMWWSCHSGYKLLYNLCRNLSSPAMGTDLDLHSSRTGLKFLLTLSLRNNFLGVTEVKYVIFSYVLGILLSFSYYFR